MSAGVPRPQILAKHSSFQSLRAVPPTNIVHIRNEAGGDDRAPSEKIEWFRRARLLSGGAKLRNCLPRRIYPTCRCKRCWRRVDICSAHQSIPLVFPSICHHVWARFGISELNKSIGTGKTTKLLCSLPTSVTVCRNRICIAIGCSSIIAAASRSRAAA